MPNKNKITIDGVDYVRKDSITSVEPAKKLDRLPYMIIRTYSAGVFAGYLKSKNGQEATILQARRLFYWDGAASLSQLSQEGVTKPQNCKFPCEVPTIEVTQAIEFLPCTEKARLSIKSVKVWEM